MRIYISIPITGHDEQKQREHADLMKSALSRAGHEVTTPFEVYAGKNPAYEDHICHDLLALSRCDGIFLCKGWQFSKGCRIESYFAKEFGKTFMYERQTNDAEDLYYYNR